MIDKQTEDIIIKHGSGIIGSELFAETFLQKHHVVFNVGDHLLGVTAEAVSYCIKNSLTEEPFLDNVVKACLCHDLGIMGRREKFNNDFQCLIWHPIDSVSVYRKVTGEDNEVVVDSILSHMFPLKLRVPKYKEGWILIRADKKAAYSERLGRPLVSEEERKELIRLCTR
jgi:uncharacterized protein